jgi:hypothetical protein
MKHLKKPLQHIRNIQIKQLQYMCETYAMETLMMAMETLLRENQTTAEGQPISEHISQSKQSF